MDKIKKNDFVEIEFTGRNDGMVFDTTDKVEAKKIGLEVDVKPIIASVGNKMLLEGLDEELVGKEIGKEYSVDLEPNKAFGKRNPSLIRTIPLRVFREKNMNPAPGMTIQLDNNIAKILSVSGGRITVDFNNPLAGKLVNYKFKVKKKVEDDNDKINGLQDFFFRRRFEFLIKGDKVIFKDEKLGPVLDMFKDKFKELVKMDFVVEEKKVEKKVNREKISEK